MLASQVNGKPVITMLVQNAKVLSAGKLSARDSAINATGAAAKGESTTITIMVTVDEASKIQLASSSGIMSLSLRGDEDTVESSESTTVTIDSVFGISAPKGTPVAGKEGTVKIGSRTFVVINGKLVPEEPVDGASSKSR
jgi:Flp pilus assembly protein CpaB